MEEWRDIPGYIGLYQASNEGRIRSLIRLLPDCVMAGMRREKKVLAFGSNRQGRLQVVLCRDGETKRFQVHTLVLLAWKGACPEGMECRHDNGNHLDNRPGNLFWGTHAENMHDMVRHGTATGWRLGFRKVTQEMREEILASEGTLRELGKRFGVSSTTIYNVKAGKHAENALC